MRQGSNGRRGRGRGSGRKPQNNRNQSFDSNGPSGRIRGTAAQLHEKYLSLARDASASGDRITAENCYQHADHYYRIVLANQVPSDPYLDDSADLDADDPLYRQNGREQHGRDGNGRDYGQRRRMNGNGHDADGNRDFSGNRDSGDRRGQRDASGSDESYSDDDTESLDTRSDDRIPEERSDDSGATGQRAKRGGGDEDAQPRERRRTRRTNGSAEREAQPPKEDAEDAGLKRALGSASVAPAGAAEDVTGAPATEAEEAPEKPRRRRRAPSTRVTD